jgi:glutathione S-transferase
MDALTVVTFDWVPEPPRGHVRDLRIRWALEEAGLTYQVKSVPFENRGPEHFQHQPFGQVPWLTDGELSIFETGAVLLHVGELCDLLLPTDPIRRSETIEWVFAALNSVEMAVVPWSFYQFSRDESTSPGRQQLDGFLKIRLDRLENVLKGREWLTGTFSIADILMVDVLRLVKRFGGLAGHPACAAYTARGEARPAFVKSHADQMAFYAAADEERKARA